MFYLCYSYNFKEWIIKRRIKRMKKYKSLKYKIFLHVQFWLNNKNTFDLKLVCVLY